MAEPKIINYNGTYVSFRQIRFYGIYNLQLLKLIWKESGLKNIRIIKRNLLIGVLSFNKDLWKCPICQNIMIYYKYDYP